MKGAVSKTMDCERVGGNCGMKPEGRPTWAEVDLDALAENFKALSSLLAPSGGGNPRIFPVVKADAYGHGMIPVSRALASAGATLFAVGTVDEGVALRRAGISQEILVLGTAWPGLERSAVQNHLTLSVDTPESVRGLESIASEMSVSIPIHLKVDTGMARLGARWDALDPLLTAVQRSGRIRLEGVFSHLSSADETDPSYTMEQKRRFEGALSAVRDAGLNPGTIHFANSAGILYHECFRQWSVRSGIALYGYSPDSHRSPVKLRPILTLKTTIGPIRSIAAGESLGYGRRFTASRKTRIGILPVGYADGFHRRLGGRTRIIVRGRCAEVIGAVSMDMIAVDLTDLLDVREGDEVTLLGSSGQCRCTAQDWAAALDTIPYEILCGIAARVPRIYLPHP